MLSQFLTETRQSSMLYNSSNISNNKGSRCSAEVLLGRTLPVP